jgi:hypothetical protein
MVVKNNYFGWKTDEVSAANGDIKILEILISKTSMVLPAKVKWMIDYPNQIPFLKTVYISP